MTRFHDYMSRYLQSFLLPWERKDYQDARRPNEMRNPFKNINLVRKELC